MVCNRARADGLMAEAGLDALVAVSPVSVYYLSGYHCWSDRLVRQYMVVPGTGEQLAQRTFAVLPRGGAPSLVVHRVFAANAADIGVGHVYTFGTGTEPLNERSNHPSPLQALVQALTERGLSTATLGVELRALHPELRKILVAGLPGARCRDATELLRFVRAVKTSVEIDRLARAAAANEAAGHEAFRHAEAGGSARDLGRRFRLSLAEHGADVDHFAYGVGGRGIALETEYRLASDDVLYADFGCTLNLYAADTGTTVALGPLPDPLSDRFTAIRRSIDAGARGLAPGVAGSSIRERMWRSLADAGYPEAFPHGHGIGLEIREYPILIADAGGRIRDECVDLPADLRLEPDMVVNLEAALFVAGMGSVHSEQTFVVTGDGGRPLVEQPRDRPLIVGQPPGG